MNIHVGFVHWPGSIDISWMTVTTDASSIQLFLFLPPLKTLLSYSYHGGNISPRYYLEIYWKIVTSIIMSMAKYSELPVLYTAKRRLPDKKNEAYRFSSYLFDSSFPSIHRYRSCLPSHHSDNGRTHRLEDDRIYCICRSNRDYISPAVCTSG